MSQPRLIASSRGARVALHDLGGDGPPVLLTHANGFCGQMWQPVAGALVSMARCWALDFRGHGDSRVSPDEDYGWDGMADDVLAAVDALDPAPRLAAGHSLGGASILKAEQARPGTFDRVWLYEPVIIPAGTIPRGGVNVLATIARRRQENVRVAPGGLRPVCGPTSAQPAPPRGVEGLLWRTVSRSSPTVR